MKNMFKPGAAGIIGRFDKQDWDDKDHGISLGEVEFNATGAILALSAKEIREIEDCDESSDHIGQDFVNHDGPCSVYLEDGILKFFGVEDKEEITPELVRAARKWLASQPIKRYQVRIACTTYKDIVLEANDPSLLQERAKAAANKDPKMKKADTVRVSEFRELA